MRPIERGEVLGLAEYEGVRDRFRNRVMDQKKLRRVELGPRASALFENRDTVLLQIQEMLRTERITRAAAVAHEIETYNELVPGQDELSCTVMIEVADERERNAFLVAAKGFERHLWLVADGQRIGARASQRYAGPTDRTTAVHYVKFPLPDKTACALRGAASGRAAIAHVDLVVDHPAYEACAALPSYTIVQLGEDLAEP